mgnify:FL=1
MSTIVVVSKPEEEELQRLNVRSWPIWEKEVSEFPWTYEEAETCYLLEGEVTVRSDEETVSFQKGDLVTFPKGLSCTWEVKKPVKKHYRFG